MDSFKRKPPILNSEKSFSCVSEVSLLDCSQMESAFSETRRTAELLQQFSGFPFYRNDGYCFHPPLMFFGHAPYPFLPCGLVCPARRFSLPWHARHFEMRPGILLRRVSSPVVGIQLSRCRDDRFFLLTLSPIQVRLIFKIKIIRSMHLD